jgi:hypothetical protein
MRLMPILDSRRELAMRSTLFRGCGRLAIQSSAYNLAHGATLAITNSWKMSRSPRSGLISPEQPS